MGGCVPNSSALIFCLLAVKIYEESLNCNITIFLVSVKTLKTMLDIATHTYWVFYSSKDTLRLKISSKVDRFIFDHGDHPIFVVCFWPSRIF